MKSSEFRNITDELLSAYLDNAISDQERALVEAAVMAEPDIAWRLDSLRQTIQLLKSLPELTLPRSFALQEAQLGDALVARHAAPRANAQAGGLAAPGFWGGLVESWRTLWQAGNPVLRNAAAASFVLLLVLVGGASLLSFQSQSPAVQVASAPASAVEEAQPAQGEVVALVAPATAAAMSKVEQPAAEQPPTQQPNAKSGPATSAVVQEEAAAQTAPAAEAVQAPAARTTEDSGEATAAPAEETVAGASPTAEAVPEIAAAASAFAIQEESAQEESTASEGDVTPAQPEAVPATEGSQAQAEPALTPVAPVPGGMILGGPEAPGMGGGGGDGMGAGGGPGAPGDLAAYPDGEGGLLPPGAYESGPDFVPAEPAGVTAQAVSPLETQAEAIAMVPPAEPTATPIEEPPAVESTAVENTPAETAVPADIAPESAAPQGTAGESAASEVTVPATPVVTVTATRAVLVTGSGLLRLAQIGLGLITLMLTSLWWYSRGEMTKP